MAFWQPGRGYELVLLVATGCYAPTAQPGIACGAGEACPAGLTCIGGRCELPGEPSDGPRNDTATDGPDPTDAAIDAFVVPFCDPSDTTLVGCWPLEGTALDGSGRGNSGVVTSVTFVPGHDGFGAQMATGSTIRVADAASLTPAALTMEAWIRPTALPTGATRMGVLDNDGSFGLYVFADRVQCNLTYPQNVSVAQVPVVGVWTHLGCTYDGAVGKLFINGTEVATGTLNSALGAGSTNGTAIGSNSPSGEELSGLIDQVRVWSVARTPAQLCTAAGRTTCP